MVRELFFCAACLRTEARAFAIIALHFYSSAGSRNENLLTARGRSPPNPSRESRRAVAVADRVRRARKDVRRDVSQPGPDDRPAIIRWGRRPGFNASRRRPHYGLPSLTPAQTPWSLEQSERKSVPLSLSCPNPGP